MLGVQRTVRVVSHFTLSTHFEDEKTGSERPNHLP